MATKPARTTKEIWLFTLLLFVCVAVTAVALISHLGGYAVDDSGAIDLMMVPAAADTTVGTTTTTATSATSATKAPTFQIEDEKQVWSTDTRVEIFRVSYENGEQVVTVHSADGDRLIAPGTANTYVFKLKNTGSAAVQYRLEINATVEGADTLPVEARLSRYDGHWLAGDSHTYADLTVLDAAMDDTALGAGRFTYYTLDWQWPFEGDDRLDTLLGNQTEDVTLTIEIKTTATLYEDPDDDSGLRAPETGDTTRRSLWIALAVGSAAMMLLFLLAGRRRDEDEDKKNTAPAGEANP